MHTLVLLLGAVASDDDLIEESKILDSETKEEFEKRKEPLTHLDGTISFYEFGTEEERDAFVKGVETGFGWSSYLTFKKGEN